RLVERNRRGDTRLDTAAYFLLELVHELVVARVRNGERLKSAIGLERYDLVTHEKVDRQLLDERVVNLHVWVAQVDVFQPKATRDLTGLLLGLEAAGVVGSARARA